MRFRKLTLEELAPLEKEFKQFLIVNNIHDAEWRNLNLNELAKVNALIEVFSDAVLLKVYGKISHLEFHTKDNFSLFEINTNWIESIHILSKSKEFEIPTKLQDVFSFPDRFTIQKGKKKILGSKEDEVHKLILKGCIPCSKINWKLLDKNLKAILPQR